MTHSPHNDPDGLRATVDRFAPFRGRKVVAISATPTGIKLRFEDGYELGPIARGTEIQQRNIVTVKL